MHNSEILTMLLFSFFVSVLLLRGSLFAACIRALEFDVRSASSMCTHVQYIVHCVRAYRIVLCVVIVVWCLV